MKMDRVDKIISMISDVVVTAYNCGEPLFTNHTTSLSAEKNEVLKKVEENISNPLSFKGFVKRMQTYNIKYWYAHRHAALQLARGGWENVSEYVVRCCFCDAEEDLRALVSTQEEALLKLLSKQHASFCRWRTASSPEFFACAPHVQSSQGLRNTVTATAGQLVALGRDLPKVPDVVLRAMKLGNETLELLVCGLLKDVPVNDVSVSAVVLTLCGWCLSSTKGILCCCYCDRRIALRHWISVQTFEEQRRLMLSENNASFMQTGFVDDAQDKEEGSQSPLSELSHVDSDWDDEEEEPEEEEDGDEEMEAVEYEVYDQEAEQDDFITVDNEIYGNELNSKLKNSQNNHIQEKKYEAFQNHDQDVEMEEDYDELEAQELVESNYNEEDDVDDYTDDEIPPNEDGPYDNTQEVETSDESIISDNEEDLQEEKTANLKIPHKQVQYHNNENEQNEEYHNAVENQYSNSANEIGSSDDDVLVENDVRLEVEEEEIEHEKGEEIGDEDEENDEDDCDDEDDDEDDDDEDDDDDDDDEEEEDEDEEDYDEMPEDGRSQGNDSDKVIELSDSDEEIEPQSKEKVQTIPSPTSVMMVETEVIVTELASDENKQNSCEKLSDKPDTKIEGVGLSGDSKNQDPKSVNSEKENILKINVDKVESQDGVTLSEKSEKQEKTTLKRKRDNENDIGLELDAKRKPISFDDCNKESPIDENGTVVVAGDLEDDKSSMQVGKIPLDEGAEKNSEICQDDDNLTTSEAYKSRVVEERVTCEDTHCEVGELNGLKNKCEEEISGSTGTAGVGVTEVSNSEQTEIKSTEQEDASLVATRGGGGETVVITETECVPTTAVPASEVGSSAAVARSEAVSPSDCEPATQKQTVPAGKSAENGPGNMPVLSPEVRSESSGTGTPQPAPDSEDAGVNMPVLVREVKQERGKVEAPAAPSAAQGEGSENKVTESPASVEASKEDSTPGETGHSVDATRCVTEKLPHAGEDKVEPEAESVVGASSSQSEKASEGASCEPKPPEDVCPEESAGTEGNEAAGQDGEAMDVCEASEQVAGRGTKRSRGSESESEQSQPAAKRLQPDAEVQKPRSLLDPIAEHRFWCLWAPARTAASYQRKCGWEVVFQDIMDRILQQRQEQDHADITRKVRRMQEQIFPL